MKYIYIELRCICQNIFNGLLCEGLRKKMIFMEVVVRAC